MQRHHFGAVSSQQSAVSSQRLRFIGLIAILSLILAAAPAGACWVAGGLGIAAGWQLASKRTSTRAAMRGIRTPSSLHASVTISHSLYHGIAR